MNVSLIDRYRGLDSISIVEDFPWKKDAAAYVFNSMSEPSDLALAVYVINYDSKEAPSTLIELEMVSCEGSKF